MNLDYVTKTELLEELELLRSINNKLWHWVESQKRNSLGDIIIESGDWQETFVDTFFDYKHI